MDSSSDSEQERAAGAEAMRNARVIVSDFTPEQEVAVVKYATEAMNKHKMDKDSATDLKRRIDADANFRGGGLGAWQVLVGRSFAVSVTHETSYLMYFNLIQPRRTVLIFKSQ